jgi:hypothetical protein
MVSLFMKSEEIGTRSRICRSRTERGADVTPAIEVFLEVAIREGRIQSKVVWFSLVVPARLCKNREDYGTESIAPPTYCKISGCYISNSPAIYLRVDF